MDKNKLADFLLQELEAEYKASKKCLERIPETLFEFKPHPTAMAMGYLTSLVSEIPLWVSTMIEQDEIDLATFPHPEVKTTADVVQHFEDNFKGAVKALKHSTDETLAESFSLKGNGKTLAKAPRLVHIGSTLNHWVHHRGQLTVYMRMNEIEIPSIYGPSADDNPFK